MKTLVILGSNREDSQTLQAVQTLIISHEADCEMVDLSKLEIEHYSYHQTHQDDFFEIATRMQQAEHLVFATPVYWYSMSGRMKVFFDRLSDLISTHKPIGRSFAGKSVSVIATGADASLPPGFEIPFQMTAEYFGMTYLGARYIQSKPVPASEEVTVQ